MSDGTESRDPDASSTGALLRRALEAVERRYEAGETATVGDLLGPLGARTPALGAVLLALPFLSPVSLGPIATPVSLAIALLGWGMLRRGGRVSLPARILALPIPRPVHRHMGGALRRVARWTERGRNARPSRWVRGTAGMRLCGAGVVTGAVLLAVPVPLLPLTNTFPALAIICFALGWANRDVRLTRVGVGAIGVSVALFAALGTAVATLGWAAVRQVAPF